MGMLGFCCLVMMQKLAIIPTPTVLKQGKNNFKFFLIPSYSLQKKFKIVHSQSFTYPKVINFCYFQLYLAKKFTTFDHSQIAINFKSLFIPNLHVAKTF